MMASCQRRSCRYPSLRVTVKYETDERSVTELPSNPRTYRSKDNYHSTTIYYNRNHRQKQHFNHPSSPPPPIVQRRSPKYPPRHNHPNPPQPIRPLMEIKDNQFPGFDDNAMSCSYIFKQKEPKQRGQYRNRKAELDWDHAFDLDQIDLYTTQTDNDNHSLTSINSSSDNSFSSVY